MTIADKMERARSGGRSHETRQRGHRVSELNDSTFAETSIIMVCNACTWTASASGPREEWPR